MAGLTGQSINMNVLQTDIKGEANTETSVTNHGSNLNFGSLVITSNQNTNIMGSNINTTGDANITTINGNVNILSVTDSTHSLNENWHSGDVSLSGNMSLLHMNASVTVSTEIHHESETINTTTQIGSSINAWGSININSGNNVQMTSSSLNAGNQVALEAEGNITASVI